MTLIQAFAESMTYVGQAVEKQFERQQVEWVLGLTGGELEKDPLAFRAPSRWNGIEGRKWTYHYEGFPEWAYEDFGMRCYEHDSSQYHTLISVGVSYESGAPEEMDFGDERWFRVRDYVSSGETECPMGSCGDNETVGEDSTEGFERCPLCDEEKGEKHGYIYLGSCVETVYRHIDIECAECCVPHSEIKASPENTTCDCEE